MLAVLRGGAEAHRSGCHRWHSCPSDTGSYVCGDLGYCSQCPDNRYCLNGQPRQTDIVRPSPAARPAPAVPLPSPEGPARAPTPGTTLGREAATIIRVIDGDTVDVEVGGRRERLRLIGLDTPESVDPRRPVECFGREASARAKALLPAGARVQLEADATQGERDRYGRLLRYIVLADGRNFAEVMIRDGYGFEYTFRFPYRYQDAFKAAQREARANERGLWKPGACPEFRDSSPATAAPSTGLR